VQLRGNASSEKEVGQRGEEGGGARRQGYANDVSANLNRVPALAGRSKASGVSAYQEAFNE